LTFEPLDTIVNTDRVRLHGEPAPELGHRRRRGDVDQVGVDTLDQLVALIVVVEPLDGFGDRVDMTSGDIGAFQRVSQRRGPVEGVGAFFGLDRIMQRPTRAVRDITFRKRHLRCQHVGQHRLRRRQPRPHTGHVTQRRPDLIRQRPTITTHRRNPRTCASTTPDPIRTSVRQGCHRVAEPGTKPPEGSAKHAIEVRWPGRAQASHTTRSWTGVRLMNKRVVPELACVFHGGGTSVRCDHDQASRLSGGGLRLDGGLWVE
jgi:hypothetical protein